MTTPSAITSDQVNYLVWRYLQESGFENSTFSFQDDSHAEKLENRFGSWIKTGALVHMLQKGMQYLALEAAYSQSNEVNMEVDYAFFGTPPGMGSLKSGLRREVPRSADGDVEMGMAGPSTDSTQLPTEQNAHNDTVAESTSTSQTPGESSSQLQQDGQQQVKRNREDTITNGTGKPLHPRIKRPKTGEGDESPSVMNGISEPDTTSEEVRATLGADMGTQVDDIIELDRSSQHIINLSDEKAVAENSKLPTTCVFHPENKNVLASSAFKNGRIFTINDDGSYSSNEFHANEEDEITELVWSPSGDTIATGTMKGRVNIYNHSGKFVRAFTNHVAPIVAIKYCPHWNALLSIDAMRTMALWDLNSGKFMQAWIMESGQDPIDAEWLNRDTFVAVGKSGTVIKHEIPENSTKFIGHGKNTTVCTIAWNELQSIFATSGDDGKVILWQPDNTSPYAVFEGHKNGITQVKWFRGNQKNSHLLASASYDSTIRVWDSTAKTFLHELVFGQGPVYCLSFSPDGRHLACGRDNALAVIWQLEGERVPLCVYNGRKSKEQSLNNLASTLNPSIEGLSWDSKGEKIALAVNGQQCIVVNWNKVLEAVPNRPSGN